MLTSCKITVLPSSTAIPDLIFSPCPSFPGGIDADRTGIGCIPPADFIVSAFAKTGNAPAMGRNALICADIDDSSTGFAISDLVDAVRTSVAGLVARVSFVVFGLEDAGECLLDLAPVPTVASPAVD